MLGHTNCVLVPIDVLNGIPIIHIFERIVDIFERKA